MKYYLCIILLKYNCMNNLNITYIIYSQSLFFPSCQSMILTHLFPNPAEGTYPYLQDPNPIII